MGFRKLGADVVDVVRHATQDRLDDGGRGIAPFGVVAVDLLDPLQVHDRHHPDQQVHAAGSIVAVTAHAAVQALVEEKVRGNRERFPGREFAGFELRAEPLVVLGRFLGAVEVVAPFAGTRFAVVPERLLQLVEDVGLRPEVGEGAVGGNGLGHLRLHGEAVVAVEAVALNHHRVDAFSPEDVFKGTLHRGGTGSRGARDGYDRMLLRHLRL